MLGGRDSWLPPQVALALAGPGVEATWGLWVRGGRLQLPKMWTSALPRNPSPSVELLSYKLVKKCVT